MFSSVSGVDTAFATALGGGKSAGVIFVGAACHAVAQGALSMMQGGKFLSGAAAGFLGHLGGAAWGEIGGNFAGSDVGVIGFGALSGGVGAELTGGNFWQGAVTGGIVAGLNTAFHNGFDSIDSFEDIDQDGQIRATTEVKPAPSVSTLDPAYKVGNQEWETKGSGLNTRKSITTKKEILQWDSKKGEIEVYNRSNKKHLGGYDPTNKSRRITRPSNRTPTGGWGVNNRNVVKSVISSIPQLRMLNALDSFIGPFIPYSLYMTPITAPPTTTY